MIFKKVKALGLGMAIVLIVLVIFSPFIWLLISSISLEKDLYVVPPQWIPTHPTLTNYSHLFKSYEGDNFRRGLFNSCFISISVVVISLIIAAPAAYAFARLRFPLQAFTFAGILIMQMIPAIVLAIPIYFIFANILNLIDTKLGLIMINTSFAVPFAIWILWRFFQTIPLTLEDAAMVDGCSRIKALIKIILPLSAPGVVTAGVFVFLSAWNEFFFALILTNTYNAKPLTVAVTELEKKTGIDYGLASAAGLITAIIPVIISLFFQRYIIKGLTSGGVKG